MAQSEIVNRLELAMSLRKVHRKYRRTAFAFLNMVSLIAADDPLNLFFPRINASMIAVSFVLEDCGIHHFVEVIEMSWANIIFQISVILELSGLYGKSSGFWEKKGLEEPRKRW